MASGQHQPTVPRWKPSPPRPQGREADDVDQPPQFDAVSDMSASVRSTDGFPFGSGRSSFAPPPFLPARQPSLEIRAAENGGGGGVAREPSLRRPDQGVVLAWEDLWVSAAGGKSGRVPILCGLNGYARPGEVLAIMGPSGCGKSTLLDALAGNVYTHVN